MIREIRSRFWNRIASESIEFANTRARALLAAGGLSNLDAVMRFGRPLACRHRGRSLAVGELRDGDRVVRVFVKKQDRPLHRIPRWADLRHDAAFSPYPVCEWRGLILFRQAGLSTPEPIALLRGPWCSARAAVITEALDSEESLGEMIRGGLLGRLEPDHRQALIDALVGAIERIHGAGLGWRGMESKHFYPVLCPDGTWRIWLLDCESVHHRLTRRDVQRQREKFLRKLHAVGADGDFMGEIARRLSRTSAS